MMSENNDLPAPPVSAEVDLRDFPFVPMYRVRLFGSAFHARANDAEWRAGVTLWLRSWDQVPAGSLPDDDVELCRLAEFGRDIKAWQRVKTRALHGWVLCSDGRLHHEVVAEGVLEAWGKRTKASKKGKAGALKRWSKGNATSNARANATANAPAIAQAMPGDSKGQGQGQGQGESKNKNGADPKTYAFAGKVIRLAQRDYDAWRKTYHAIADFDAELQSLDDYYASNGGDGWFHRVSQNLLKKHRETLERRGGKSGRTADQEVLM